mmetsp:Transcript_1776/g.2100  ORF Transcript_1776/g.2100 Transcript_1776/m.2100 type:complete len:415 (-) Transcript_1776:161-1405(-)
MFCDSGVKTKVDAVMLDVMPTEKMMTKTTTGGGWRQLDACPPLDKGVDQDLPFISGQMPLMESDAYGAPNPRALILPPATNPTDADVSAVRRMIAPLSKEQLAELLAVAATHHCDVWDSCSRTVKDSPASRRLMIRNIAFTSKDEDFLALFSQFGDVDDAVIVRDRCNKSKGFGFITFRTDEGVRNCFNAVELVLDGRNLLAKLAADPYADFCAGGANMSDRRKLFIRNLAEHTTSDSLRNLFSQYGPLEKCVVVCSPSGQSRGYGFVTFQSSESAIKAVQQPQRLIEGKVVFVSFATPTRTRKPSQTGTASVGTDTTGNIITPVRSANVICGSRLSQYQQLQGGVTQQQFRQQYGVVPFVGGARSGGTFKSPVILPGFNPIRPTSVISGGMNFEFATLPALPSDMMARTFSSN